MNLNNITQEMSFKDMQHLNKEGEEDLYDILKSKRHDINVDFGPRTYSMLQQQMMLGNEAYVKDWMEKNAFIEQPEDFPPKDNALSEEYCPDCRAKLKEIIKESIDKLMEKEKPGLWANIRAKRARVGKKGMAKKGSKAYKTAKKAGDKINKEVDEAKTKPAKGKRFAKKVKNPKTGRTRTVSYGQAGKAKKGGDRIRPGTAKGHAYCARSAKIKKCKNPPCANTLSRKKWKCQGSRSVK